MRPRRRIRQGYLLATIQFVRETDALAICTAQVCEHGLLKGFQMPWYLIGISLHQYADDSNFFTEGSGEKDRNISTLLDLFAKCSGLQINWARSAFPKRIMIIA